MNPRIIFNRLSGLLLAAAIFVIDQWLKWLMIERIELRQARSIELNPWFNLTWVENFGVSLGMFTAQSSEMRSALIAVTAGIALIVFVWMLRERRLWDILALGLVLGGALGNIRDRWAYGYVVDYADLHFGEFRPFLVFNLADAAITIGVLIILVRSFLSREKRPEPEKTPEPEAELPATES